MPNRSRASCSRPQGISGTRYRHTQAGRHYYDPHSAKWHNPSSAQESRYSDFVPCSYDERTFLTRLFNYARALLIQSNGGLLQRSPALSSSCSVRGLSTPYSPSDIEMLTSSPSPTTHTRTSTASCSPRSYNGSSGLQRSPHIYIKPPPRVALPHGIASSSKPQSQSRKRPLSAPQSPATKVMIDSGTQYSPPSMPMDPPNATGKPKGASPSPTLSNPPPEPPLEPQKPEPQKPETRASRAHFASSSQARTASSTTLAKTSSSSSSSHGSSPKRARSSKTAVKTMPARYETCDTSDLVVLISNMLMELIRFNDEIPLRDGRLTRFHSRAPPGISVIDYLQRLTTHATLSPPILLSMVYYIDRLCALYPAFTISSLTVHRFLITAATVASKGLSDSFWTNNTYARVGGVSLKELALLELEFLWRVEWRIVPKPEVLVDYYRSLVERSEGFRIEDSSSSDGSSSSGISSRIDSAEKMELTDDTKMTATSNPAAVAAKLREADDAGPV